MPSKFINESTEVLADILSSDKFLALSRDEMNDLACELFSRQMPVEQRKSMLEVLKELDDELYESIYGNEDRSWLCE